MGKRIRPNGIGGGGQAWHMTIAMCERRMTLSYSEHIFSQFKKKITRVANSCWRTHFSKFSWKDWSNSKRNHYIHTRPIFTRHISNSLGVGLPFLKDGGMELEFVTLRTCKCSTLQVIVRLYLSKNSWYCSFSCKSEFYGISAGHPYFIVFMVKCHDHNSVGWFSKSDLVLSWVFIVRIMGTKMSENWGENQPLGSHPCENRS
jgi:hypothetical protein